MNKALLSSNLMDWETPIELFDELDREFHFTLDPCCYARTAKCAKFFTEEDDGLAQDWSNDIVFMNPPYGKEMPKWIEKAYLESLKGATVVCLIPSRTDTKYFHDYIKPYASIRFLKGRVKFLQHGESRDPAPFPSMICIFRPPYSYNYETDCTDVQLFDWGLNIDSEDAKNALFVVETVALVGLGAFSLYKKCKEKYDEIEAELNLILLEYRSKKFAQ